MDPRFIRYNWDFKIAPKFDKTGALVSAELNVPWPTEEPQGLDRALIEQEGRSFFGRWGGGQRRAFREWVEKQQAKRRVEVIDQVKDLVLAAQDYERLLGGASPEQAGKKNPEGFLARRDEIESTYRHKNNPIAQPSSRTTLGHCIRTVMGGRLDLAAESQEKIERLLRLYWEGDHLALLAAQTVPRPPAPAAPVPPPPPPPPPPSPVEQVRSALKADGEILAAVLLGRREAFAQLDAYLAGREAEGASPADIARERKHFTELIESRLRDIQREIADTVKPPASSDKATP